MFLNISRYSFVTILFKHFVYLYCLLLLSLGFPDSSVGKEFTCNAGDPGSIPGSGRSAGEGIDYPLQYSGLENSMACIVHGVTKSQMWLCNFKKKKKIQQLTSTKKYSCLGNPTDCIWQVPLENPHKQTGAWLATVHGVVRSWTWLSNNKKSCIPIF